jgi:hypothetical protein
MQYLSPFPGFRKTTILSRREEELRHTLKNGLDPEKVRKAAERVRTARLHLIKALRHSREPCSAEANTGDLQARMQRWEKEKELWERRPVEAIVSEYASEAHPIS